HQDGLVHISAMANAYVKDPRTIAKPGDVVRVKVLEADPKRRRIALTYVSIKLWKRGRPQHARKSPQRDRRNISDPPGPPAAMRWLRRFGEPGWRVGRQGGNSATGL